MSAEIPAEALQLRSLVRADQILELFLDLVPVSEPGPDERVIRVEAAPLNPSDMGLLFGGADMAAPVAAGLTTTFASSYTAQVSLPGALSLEAIADYGRQATGSKYVVIPSRAA
jgi:NADPH:quinone reductase-like Zn-dependent oxidoreductase